MLAKQPGGIEAAPPAAFTTGGAERRGQGRDIVKGADVARCRVNLARGRPAFLKDPASRARSRYECRVPK
jgi:hypothetical protein